LFGLESDVTQQQMDMAGLLEDEVAQFLTDGKVKSLKRLLVSAFSLPGRELFKMCCTNWSPTSGQSQTCVHDHAQDAIQLCKIGF